MNASHRILDERNHALSSRLKPAERIDYGKKNALSCLPMQLCFMRTRMPCYLDQCSFSLLHTSEHCMLCFFPPFVRSRLLDIISRISFGYSGGAR